MGRADIKVKKLQNVLVSNARHLENNVLIHGLSYVE